ncbi:MAG: hypothetical protein HYS89_02055 [Candidatus Colwellbacteria bacterium]|nr:hypothetical protein [Candidatus Colwellbacteria bacterium]
MLDYLQYNFKDGMSRDEWEALDLKRQTFVLRAGWPSLGTVELEEKCLELIGHLPY